MNDPLRYARYDALSCPAAAISPDGTVLYANEAARSYSSLLCAGTDLLPCFSSKKNEVALCLRTRRARVADLCLPKEHAALLLPDFTPEGAAVILVAAPLPEELLLTGDRPQPPPEATEDAVDLPDGKTLSILGQTLLRSYARLPLSAGDLADSLKTRTPLTIGQSCGFLEEAFSRCFSQSGCSASVRCTADARSFPLADPMELLLSLLSLSILLAMRADDRRVSLFFSCKQERPDLLFSYVCAKDTTGEEFSRLLPERKIELQILEAIFDRLGYDRSVRRVSGRTDLELTGRERFPASFFKRREGPPRPEERRILESLFRLTGLP